jgi:hypothetical protein
MDAAVVPSFAVAAISIRVLSRGAVARTRRASSSALVASPSSAITASRIGRRVATSA